MTVSSRVAVGQVPAPLALGRRSDWWSRVRSAGEYSFADAAARVAVFVALVYAARVLGPRAFGEFAIVYTAAQITTLIADMGLTTLVLRQGARSGRVHRAPFWTAAALNGAACTVCAAVLVGVFALVHPSAAALAAIYVPTLLFLALTTSFEGAAIAAGRPVRVAGCRLAGNACVLVLTLAFLSSVAASPELVALAFLVGGLVKLASIAVATRPLVPAVRVRRRLALPLVRQGAPFYGSSIAAFLYQRVDVLLLAGIAGVAVVGEYAAAYRVLDGLLLLPVAVVAAFLPSWTTRRRSHASGEAAAAVVLLLVCIGVLAAVELVITREFVVRVLYGELYGSSADVLAVLAVSVPIFYADIALVWIAYARGRERAVVLLGVIALVVNVALNIVLIRAFEGVGAAAATVVTEAGVGVGYLLLLGVHRGDRRRRAVRLLLTASAYTAALCAVAFACLESGVRALPASLAVLAAGGALLAVVYRRVVRPAAA